MTEINDSRNFYAAWLKERRRQKRRQWKERGQQSRLINIWLVFTYQWIFHVSFQYYWYKVLMLICHWNINRALQPWLPNHTLISVPSFSICWCHL